MPAPRLTTDEYLRTPETMLPQELVYGLVRDCAAPTPRHQDTVGRYYRALHRQVERTGAGRVWMSPIDVVLDADRALVVQPDLVVIRRERLHIVTDRIDGAPDLVVEVLSPRPRIGTLGERLTWFATYGVRECWLVHVLTEHVEVVTFADGGIARRDILTDDGPIPSTVVPGFFL